MEGESMRNNSRVPGRLRKYLLLESLEFRVFCMFFFGFPCLKVSEGSEGPEGRVPRVSLAQLQEPLVLQGALRLWLGRSEVLFLPAVISSFIFIFGFILDSYSCQYV